MTGETLLFHVSDIHFGLENNEALDWFSSEVVRMRPSAIAITGDLTMRARAREFAAAKEWVGALEAPVTLDVGNHDMPYFNLIERFFDPYKRFGRMRDVVEREIDLPGIALVPLKTAVRMQPRFNWSKGWVSQRALDRCLAALDVNEVDVERFLGLRVGHRHRGNKGKGKEETQVAHHSAHSLGAGRATRR